MSRRIRFDEAASTELYEAVRWYEAQRTGLGADMVSAVEEALDFLEDNPQAGSTVAADQRRVILKKFPYQLVYHVRPEEIVVVAVAHLKRRPGYWRRR